jgi:hypothetical protein
MDFLQEAQAIYETMTAKAENVWVTVYPDPGGKNNCLFAGEGDPSDQWHLMESIMRNAANRYNRFKIRVALGSKNAMPQEIPVSVTRSAQSQVAGIGAVPGVYGYGQHDIGAIEKRIEEKFEQRMAHEKALREKDDEINALKYEAQQRKKKGDTLDQIGAFCEAQQIDLNPIIQGLVMKIPALFARKSAPMPGIAGPRTEIHHHPANNAVAGYELEEEEDQNMIDLNETIYKELLYQGGHDESVLVINYAPVIMATIQLHQFIGGLKAMALADDNLDAVDILVKTADFIVKNPKKAQELVKQMQGDTNQVAS